MSKLKWEGINFPSEKDDWNRFEKKNVTIALNVLYAKNEKIHPAYVSKNNSNCEKQAIFLMIQYGKGWWYYLLVNKLSALLTGIISKNNGDFYCLNCLHSFRIKIKLELHKRT